jgi:hypothetical protein
MIKFAARFIVLAAVLALLPVAGAGVLAAGDPSVDIDTRKAIEAVLKKRAGDLLAEKDKDGISHKRGTYSKDFKRVDATTYLATFNVDTVEPSAEDPKTDRLKTERTIVTLKSEAGGWKIAKEEVKDTTSQLYRGWFGSSEIYRFDKLAFEKEGIKVSATNGFLYRGMRQGKPQDFSVFADDLSYTYDPPPDTGYYEAIKRRIVAKHPEDLVFKPERLDGWCDADSCEEIFKTAFVGLAKVSAGGGDAGGAAGAGAKGAEQKMRAAFADDAKEVEKNQKDNPFSGFWLLPEKDRRFWAFRFKKDGSKDHYALLDYDNWEPWEVRYYVTDYGYFQILGPYGPFLGTPLFAYYSEDIRKGSIPQYDLEQREDLDGRDYELASVKGSVDLALDDPEALTGDVTFVLNTKRELSVLPFGIARANVASDVKDAKNPRLFVNSIQDGDGNELSWVRRGSFDGLLYLSKAVPAGTKLTIRTRFLSLDSIQKINPTYSRVNRGGWLPFVRFADFIDQFDLTVRTPERFTVLGIGKKIGDDVDGGVRTTRWTSEKPVSFPTIIFGDYISAISDHKATKSDGTEIPVTVYVDKVSTNALDTKVLARGAETQGEIDTFRQSLTSGARDIRGKQLGPIAVQAAMALDLYKELYGIDYPFAKLDLVADPFGSFYGQAPSSIIYLGFGVFRGAGEVANGALFSGGAGITKFNEDVVAHETAHQWWGSVVANSNQRNYWFIESLAELSSAVFIERAYGKKKYLEKVADWRNNIIAHDEVTSVQNNYTVWAGEDGFSSVQSNIYNKGPYAFHVFRSTFGDEKFFQLLKAMAQELQHKEIVTRDIEEVMQKVVGGNMDWFFDQWIRGVGLPQYAINWTKRRNEQGKWIVEVDIKQRVLFGKDKTEMPGVYYRGVAPLTFVDANGKETKTEKKYLVQGPETKFALIVADEPEQVLFNKDGEILAEDGLVNRSW